MIEITEERLIALGKKYIHRVNQVRTLEGEVKGLEEMWGDSVISNKKLLNKIQTLEAKVKELEEFIGEVVVCSQLDRESSKFYEFLELEIFDKSKKLLEGAKGE